MNVQVLINGVDRTSRITMSSLRKDDALNEQADSLSFHTELYPGQSQIAGMNDDVKLYVNDVLVFGGVIVETNNSLDGHGVCIVEYECKDYSHYLNRRLVIERFENKTIDEMIDTMVDKYAQDFSTLHVNADIELEVTTFDRVTVSDALQTLARRVNYSWYVDENKDIHFFPKNEEPAPFAITDASANYIYDSVVITEDFTQLRNRVVVKGGEAEANERTEHLSGTGVKDIFALGSKFSVAPVVKVNNVQKAVGTDGIDEPDDYQVLWSFRQKSLKFTDSNIPSSGTDNITVTGIPLLPLTVIVSNSQSISQYGVYEYTREDDRLSTRDDVIALGEAELEAYAQPVREIAFNTYTFGLRSGQVLTFSSAQRNITEDFLIQKVSFQMISNELGYWTIRLATRRVGSLTQLLQQLLRAKDEKDNATELESLFNLQQIVDSAAGTDSVEQSRSSTGPYLYDTATWNFAVWS